MFVSLYADKMSRTSNEKKENTITNTYQLKSITLVLKV